MQRYRWDDYLFASACMASRERYLLTRDKVERMLDARTADEAIRSLVELGYGDGTESVSAAEFETLLSGELEKTYKLVIGMVPEQAYFEVLLYPNDYHNIKALLKAEFLGISAEGLLIDAGVFSIDEITEMIQGRNYSAMRENMAQGVEEAIEAYGTTGDPQAVDLILDRACYKDMSVLANALGIGFIKGYLSLKIDTINLKSYVRVRAMKKPRDFFSKIFIEGGSVPERLYIGGYDETVEHFADRLDTYGLKDVFVEGSQMLKDTGRFTALEKLCDNLILDYMQEAKFVTCGIEPLIAYIVAKESEIKTARIIMAGKLAGLPAESIRERVRDTYV